MKILATRKFLMNGKQCLANLYLKSKAPEDSFTSYEFQISMGNGKELNLHQNFEALLDNLSSMFAEISSDKDAVYIHSMYHTDMIEKAGYFDVFYPMEYSNKLQDKGFITDSGEVGKCLFHIETLDDNESEITIAVEFKSLIIIDEYMQVSSLWSFDKGAVAEFFKSELKNLLDNYFNYLLK